MIIGKNQQLQRIHIAKNKHAETLFQQAKGLVHEFAPVTDDEVFRQSFTKHVSDYISQHPVFKHLTMTTPGLHVVNSVKHPFTNMSALYKLEQRYKEYYCGIYDENNSIYNYTITTDIQRERFKVVKDLCKSLNSLHLSDYEKPYIKVPLVTLDGLTFVVDCEAISLLK